MTRHSKQLLVVIAEAAIEKRLVADAMRLGAHGWTVHDVRGGSEHATREGSWEADRTIELKVVCDRGVADAIGEHVLATYAPHYGVTLYFTDVEVLRPAKY
jgi:nitrogen regulatory protein P-II 2